MNINNHFTPLAWHEGNIELQSHRASYAFGHIVPLLASNISLIPFQIITESDAVDLSDCDVRLRALDGSDAVGSNLLSALGLVQIEEDDYDVIVYAGNTMSDALPTGQYYLTLESGSTVWYSDVLTIVSDVSKLTKVMWWDLYDLEFGAGMIKYKYRSGDATVQYKNWMYFLEEVGMPEYTAEEEGETRDGLFYATKLISGKKYKMNVCECTEAMCDAMRFIHLSDYVEVRDGYGRTYSCDSALVTPEWENGGAVANAEIEFTADTFVKQIGGRYLNDPTTTEDTGVIGEATIGSTFVIGT